VMTVEEHGGGKQLARIRARARVVPLAGAIAATLCGVALLDALAGAGFVAWVAGVAGAAVTLHIATDAANSLAVVREALRRLG
jgi:hypothetical protein